MAKKLQITWDSKLVIDWESEKDFVSDLRLNPLLHDINIAFQSFDWLLFIHIYRELNVKSDARSKEELSLPMGAMGFYEFIDNMETEAMEFQL